MYLGEEPDELEQKQHEEAIRQLCELYPDQRDFIRESYLDRLHQVGPEASIRTYLSIFITRQVKTLLEEDSTHH